MAKKDLVAIIKANPKALAVIDNDCWYLYREDPNNAGPDEYSPNREAWEKANELASSDDDLSSLGDGGYGSGNCYGGDILQALAKIVGLRVESV